MEVLFKTKPSQVMNLPRLLFSFLILSIGIVILQKEITIGHFIYDKGISLERWMIKAPGYFLISLPIIITIWNYLIVNTWTFEITEETLSETKGVFNVRKDMLELFRVKDISIEKPFFYRIFGLSNLILDTSDKSTPVVKMEAIPEGEKLALILRRVVEQRRTEKGVREIDAE